MCVHKKSRRAFVELKVVDDVNQHQGYRGFVGSVAVQIWIFVVRHFFDTAQQKGRPYWPPVCFQKPVPERGDD